MASVMNISVQIIGNASGLQKSIASANQSISGLGSSASKTGGILSKFSSLGLPIQAGIGAAVVAVGKAFIQAGIESEQMNAQTVAGLQSTGNAANVTLGQVQGLANGIMAYSGISDEAVQSGANMLLTFTNIQNEVGAGNDIFNQATTALADMATKMAGGATPSAEAMSSSAIKLGKALNAPITGMTALSRVGVQFTEQQKAQITAMVDAGDTMGAQKVILAELATEFGGSAQAMGSTFIGQWNIMKETVMNVVETIVVAVFKLVQPIISALIPAFTFLGQVASVVAGVLATVFSAIQPFIQPLIVGIAAIAAVIVAALIPSIIASGVAFVTAWAPVIAAGAVVAVVVAAIGAAVMGMVKLVQAGLSALSGGWSSMGTIMKAVLVVTAPLWLPIVAAIKLVQAAIGFIGNALQAVGGAISSFVASWLAGMGPVGDAIQKVIDGVNILGDISTQNAISATNAMNQFGQSVILAASQGNAEVVKMAATIQQMASMLPKAEFANAMAAGLARVDSQLKAGTISATVAQKAYTAWGLSTTEAAARSTTALAAAATKSDFMAKSADVMAAAWGKVGPQAAKSIDQIAKAITQAATAAAKMAQNTATVTNRLTQDYHLTAEQANTFLAKATPQAMATMAKAGDKGFSKVGQAAQKLNGITPNVAQNLGKVGAAAEKTGKGAEAMAKGTANATKGITSVGKGATASAKGTESMGKAAGSAAKTTDDLGKSTDDLARNASDAAGDMTHLGSSISQGTSKAASAAQDIARLSQELNGLPRSITIQVTVNVTKTGAALGGVVPGLARGGVTTNGLPLTMVGERGPELAALPPGTRVFSHSDTQSMLNSAMGESSGGGPMSISGKLTMVNGEAYIEGVVVDTLHDGRLVDAALSRRMVKPA